MGGTQDGVERWGQKTGWLAELSALTFLLLLLLLLLLLPVEAGLRGDGVSGGHPYFVSQIRRLAASLFILQHMKHEFAAVMDARYDAVGVLVCVLLVGCGAEYRSVRTVQ